MTIIMFDSVSVSQIPVGPAAVAGYIDGEYVTAPLLTARFPHARILTIATSPEHDAEALDVETGDAGPEDVPGWHGRQRKRGADRPCLYASVDLMQTRVIPVLKAAGIPRTEVRLWTAHYAGKHICAHDTCGELAIPADGTQWTDAAFGRDLDQSLLVAGFFAVPAPAPAKPPPAPVPARAPVPAWQEAMMQALPEVKLGDSGEHVRTVQGLCVARGHQITVDGSFGPATHEAVVAVQAAAHVAQDGVVGPATWAPLAGV